MVLQRNLVVSVVLVVFKQINDDGHQQGGLIKN